MDYYRGRYIETNFDVLMEAAKAELKERYGTWKRWSRKACFGLHGYFKPASMDVYGLKAHLFLQFHN